MTHPEGRVGPAARRSGEVSPPTPSAAPPLPGVTAAPPAPTPPTASTVPAAPTGPAGSTAAGSATVQSGAPPAADATAATDTAGAAADRTAGEPEAPTPTRGIDGRLARLHLRGGLLALARAELEMMAGAGTLDVEALVDLAEARWRAGDLVGAGEAAQAHLEDGGREPVAFLIAAEALAAEGRLTDARRLAALATERVGDQLERLFAGERMSSIWSRDAALAESVPRPGATDPVGPGAAPGEERGSETTGEQRSREATLTAEELEWIEQALDRGDLSLVTGRLALLLRLDPAYAPAVLSLADRIVALAGETGPDAAAVQLVRVDALTALGRATEADDGLERSRRALSGRPERNPSEETS